MATDKAALAFVERCVTEADLAALIDEFQERIAAYGFTASVCGAWAGVGQSRQYRFFFNRWPAEWLELYNREQVFLDDPFVAETRRNMVPFLWSELLPRLHLLIARSDQVRALFYGFGWRDAFAIPIHGPSGYEALVSLATMSDVSLSPLDRALLRMMAIAIHDRCRASTHLGLEQADLPQFTDREMDCLRWVAVGKTDWEIGQLLGVAPATAHFHIEKAKKKLGVTSRSQAIALMTLRGLI